MYAMLPKFLFAYYTSFRGPEVRLSRHPRPTYMHTSYNGYRYTFDFYPILAEGAF